MSDSPLVSCTMPTCGRRAFVPRAIGYFLRQTYPNRELVILDDGPDAIADLVPEDPRIRYERLTGRAPSLGAKRNLACEAARGELIVHWDDDDWMADRRIEVQVRALLAGDVDACGLDRLLFLDPDTPKAWEYRYTGPRRPWLAGGTLCYTRSAWRRHPFPDVRAGEDTRFVWSRAVRRAVALPDPSIYVALIHGGNTSPKRTRGRQWRARPVSRIREIMGEDWAFYAVERADKRESPESVRSTRGAAAALASRSGRAAAPRRAARSQRPIRPGPGAIPLYWFRYGSGRGNFGDLLSPLIVEALSRCETRHEQRRPKLLAVGSVLRVARRGDDVWGTGFIHPDDRCDRRIRVRAVRGPLTRARLLRLGVDCPEVYGDPALLLPWIRPLPSLPRQGIGIIPHYVDRDRVSSMEKDPSFRVIDILAGVERVLDAVGRCEVLLSSSLHGCVVGEAFGIPTAWVRIGDQVVGGGFKFDDYYAGTGRDPIGVDWRGGIDVDAAVRAATSGPPPDVDLEALLHAFPFLHPDVQSLDDLPVRPSRESRGRTGSPDGSTVAHGGSPSVGVRPSSSTGSGDRGWSVALKPARHADPPSDPADGPDPPRLAVFAAGTESYLPPMITALRSFALHQGNGGLEPYVLGNAFSSGGRALLRRFGIGYVDLDLTGTFGRRSGDRYPSECFWIFKGPEIFRDLGYAYSLSIDGDVWCNRPLDLSWLPRIRHLAGVDRGCTVAEFLNALGGYRRLRAHFRIAARGERRRATQSGVLFYDNAAVTDAGFFDRVVDVYRRSEGIGVRRGGDDSTLALLFAAHPGIELLRLDPTWNEYRAPSRATARDVEAVRNARIVHFAGAKPWAGRARCVNPAARSAARAWRELWKETRPEAARAPARLPASNGTSRSDPPSPYPVRCYWYRGRHPNFGDELAPYLVRKIAGLPPLKRLRDRPADPRRLTEPVLLSVGSILRLCGPNAVVWGSGIRDIDQPVAPARRFAAVRGPLTRRRLLELGYACPPVHGDPGLLLPRFYRPEVQVRYRLGVIAHHADYAHLSRLYRRERDVLVLDLRTTDIESLVRQVLRCRVTVSSALHGLVVSVAYGVPTRWLRASRRITGDGSKYYDFFASLDPAVADALDTAGVRLPDGDPALEPYRPMELRGAAIPPAELIDRTFRHEVTVDLDALMAACPIGPEGWKTGCPDPGTT